MASTIDTLIRPSVKLIHPYSPGKPTEELERELGITGAVKFASNENPLGPSPLAVEAMRDALNGLNRYGDAGCWGLRQELSRLRGLPDDHFAVVNGSSEAIYLAALLTCEPGDEIVYADPPSFLLYKAAALVTGAKPVPVARRNFVHDLDAMRGAITPRTRVLFVDNPDNPTGTSVGRAEVEKLLAAVPGHVLVVFDHADAEYAARPDFPDLLPYIREGRAVAEMRTFSKVYALAGARAAYVTAHPTLIQYFNRARLPFNVNSLAPAAAAAAVRDQDHVRRAVELNRESLTLMADGFHALGLTVVPSDANFLLIRLPMDARPVQAEMERRGVIVRSMLAFGLGPEFLRVTSGTRAQTEHLLRVFREVLAGASAAR